MPRDACDLASRQRFATSTRRFMQLADDTNETLWRVLNPDGAHAIAVGIDAPGRCRDCTATSAIIAPA